MKSIPLNQSVSDFPDSEAQTEIQFVETLSLSCNENKGIETDGFGLGKGQEFIFSSGFGPCVAIVAIFNNNISMFHASHPQPKNKNLDEFVKNILDNKSDLTDIFVLQKTNVMNKNPFYAPYIAVNIAQLVQFPVTRVLVENYDVVLADVNNHKLLIGRKVEFNVAMEKEKKYFTKNDEKPLILNSNNFISFDKTYEDVIKRAPKEYPGFKFDIVALKEILDETILSSYSSSMTKQK